MPYLKNKKNELLDAWRNAVNAFDKNFEETKEFKEFYKALDKNYPPFFSNRRNLIRKEISNFEKGIFGKSLSEARNEACQEFFDRYESFQLKVGFDKISEELIEKNLNPKDYEFVYSVANSNNGYELDEVDILE